MLLLTLYPVHPSSIFPNAKVKRNLYELKNKGGRLVFEFPRLNKLEESRESFFRREQKSKKG